MKKQELIEKIAISTGESINTVTGVIDTFVQLVNENLKNGEKVEIYSFGKFEAIDQPERVVRNPKTGEEKVSPAKKNPKFRFSPTVRKLINE